MYEELSIQNADFTRIAIAPVYEINEMDIGIEIHKDRMTFKPFGELCTVPNDVQKVTFSPCATGKETVIKYDDNGDTWVKDISLDKLDAESKYLYYYYLCVHRINRFAFVVSLWECDSAPLNHRWESAKKPPACTFYWDDFHTYDESQVALLYATTVTNPDQQMLYLPEAAERGLWDKFCGDRAVVRTVDEEAKFIERLAVCVKAARRFMKRPTD